MTCESCVDKTLNETFSSARVAVAWTLLAVQVAMLYVSAYLVARRRRHNPLQQRSIVTLVTCLMSSFVLCIFPIREILGNGTS